MIPPQFDYVRPRTVEEAVGILGENDNAKILAGGQSLLPILRLRLAYPDVVVDLNRAAGLPAVALAFGTTTAAPAPAATQAPAAEGAAGPQAAAAGESLDLVSTVAMPVLKRFGPALGGVAFGLILGLLLGHRRRIVIMTAAAPPGGYPPARTVL